MIYFWEGLHAIVIATCMAPPCVLAWLASELVRWP
jgi:hypothetical protein